MGFGLFGVFSNEVVVVVSFADGGLCVVCVFLVVVLGWSDLCRWCYVDELFRLLFSVF